MIAPEKTRLTRMAPYFPVADVEAAVRHYTSVLGFGIDYSAGNPPEFAILSRDGLPLMFRRVEDPARIRPNEQQGGTWDAFYWVTDADALCQELLAKGATLVYGPIIQADYGMKEFAVRDEAGYVLGFGESITVDRSD